MSLLPRYERDDDYPRITEKTTKTPWISLNGMHIEDSQRIIDYLTKCYGKVFSKVVKDYLA